MKHKNASVIKKILQGAAAAVVTMAMVCAPVVRVAADDPPETFVVSGTIIDDANQPVPGVRVGSPEGINNEAITDSSGEYSYAMVSGTHSLSYMNHEYNSSVMPNDWYMLLPNIDILADMTLDLTVPTSTIDITAVDQELNLVPNTAVTVEFATSPVVIPISTTLGTLNGYTYSGATGPIQTGATDESGFFRATVLTGGDYTVRLDGPNHEYDPMISEPVNVTEDFAEEYILPPLTPPDVTAPVIGEASWTLNPKGIEESTRLTVAVSDDVQVSGGEYFFGTEDPGLNSGSITEMFEGKLKLDFGANSLEPGEYVISIRGRDLGANWSETIQTTLTVYDPGA